MCANTGIKSDALDYCLLVKSLYFCVGIEFVEVADTEGKIGVGEELDCLRLLHTHEESRDILLYRSLLQQTGKFTCLSLKIIHVRNFSNSLILFLKLFPVYHLGITDDYTGRIKIVVECLRLAEEFRREEEIESLDTLGCVFYVERTAVADGDRGFDDHDGIGIDAQDEVYNILNAVGVEVVLDRVIVGRCRDYDEVGIAISRRTIEGGGKIQILLREIFLYVFILYGRLAVVDEFHFFGNHIHGCYRVVLSEKSRYTEAYIACACYCYFHNVMKTPGSHPAPKRDLG